MHYKTLRLSKRMGITLASEDDEVITLKIPATEMPKELHGLLHEMLGDLSEIALSKISDLSMLEALRRAQEVAEAEETTEEIHARQTY